METSTAKIIKRLKQDGWWLERNGKEHDIYRHSEKGEVQVPRHRNLSAGVARSIAKKAGWASEALPSITSKGAKEQSNVAISSTD